MGFQLIPAYNNLVLRRRVVEGIGYAGVLVSSSAKNKLIGQTYKNWWVYNDASEGDKNKWLFLTYNQENCTWEDCILGPRDADLIRNDGMGIEGAWSEHNLYIHNPLGDLTFRRVKNRRAGSQGLQISCRWGESYEYQNGILNGTEWFENVGTHLVEFGETVQCGLWGMPLAGGAIVPRGGMASFSLTFFGKQYGINQTNWGPRSEWNCPVVIRGHTIRHSTAGAPAGWTLNGAIVVEWRPEALFEGVDCEFAGPANQELVLCNKTERVIMREGPYMKPDGTIGSRKCSFRGQRPFKIDGVGFGRVKLIDIEPNDSTVDLLVDGVNKGPLSRGFHYVA